MRGEFWAIAWGGLTAGFVVGFAAGLFIRRHRPTGAPRPPRRPAARVAWAVVAVAFFGLAVVSSDFRGLLYAAGGVFVALMQVFALSVTAVVMGVAEGQVPGYGAVLLAGGFTAGSVAGFAGTGLFRPPTD